MTPADTSSVPSHPLIESDHIEGTAVYDASGKRIESIKRLVIEKVSGHVVYAVTAFGGFLGLGAETHTIPWEQLHYDTALGGYKPASRKSSFGMPPSSPVAMMPSCRATSGRSLAGSTRSPGEFSTRSPGENEGQPWPSSVS